MLNRFIQWLKSLFNGGKVVDVPKPIEGAVPIAQTSYEALFFKAKSQWGQKEIYGAEDNPQIVNYFTATDYGHAKDEIRWCAAFINWCLRECNFPRTKSAAAVSFLKWGVPLSMPTQGCVIVLQHPNGNHHVGLFGHVEGNYIFLLGGNQSNSVCIAGFHKSEVMKDGIRGFA